MIRRFLRWLFAYDLQDALAAESKARREQLDAIEARLDDELRGGS